MSEEDIIRRMAGLNISPRQNDDFEETRDEQLREIETRNEHNKRQNFNDFQATQERRGNELLAASLKQFSERLKASFNQRRSVRFDDVEKTFKRFTGSSHINFNAWLTHFEEQSLLYDLTLIEKFIFAKRLMKNEAKLFIEFESQAKNYNELVQELKNEFGRKTNSAIIHQKLRSRPKKKEETPIQYLYEMLSLAAHSDIDHAAIITYTIEGLPGTLESKAFMYEAQTINEFKGKLRAYDLMNFKNNNTKSEYENKENQQFDRKNTNCVPNKPEEEHQINTIKQIDNNFEEKTSEDKQNKLTNANQMMIIQQYDAKSKSSSIEDTKKKEFNDLLTRFQEIEKKYEINQAMNEQTMIKLQKLQQSNEFLKTKLESQNATVSELREMNTKANAKINELLNTKITKDEIKQEFKTMKYDSKRKTEQIKEMRCEYFSPNDVKFTTNLKSKNDSNAETTKFNRIQSKKANIFRDPRIEKVIMKIDESKVNTFQKTGERKDDRLKKKDGRCRILWNSMP